MSDFSQIGWDELTQRDWQDLLQLAVREDLAYEHDWTTVALVPAEAEGFARVVARQPGILAGLPAAAQAAAEYSRQLRFTAVAADGQAIERGQVVAEIQGPARPLLSCERVVLNVLSRLSGIATLTRRYVDAAAGTKARIYDTRKTTPGWRRLEKYAVRLGGGHNHRTGLFDAVLIKDNHLALRATHGGADPGEAVRAARRFLDEHLPAARRESMLIEVEVDSLPQLEAALAAGPDLVLLDNMPPDMLRAAVGRRDALAPQVELEASGGVRLETVAEVAQCGVDRISVGALTHAAAWLDIGLDWAGA